MPLCVWRRKWQPTPVFLPEESQGQRSLVGCCLWGHTDLVKHDRSDLAAAAAASSCLFELHLCCCCLSLLQLLIYTSVLLVSTSWIVSSIHKDSEFHGHKDRSCKFKKRLNSIFKMDFECKLSCISSHTLQMPKLNFK